MRKAEEERVLMEVYLNVYDFLQYNPYLKCLGMDVYHTGVEIGDVQYCYFVTDIDPEASGIISIQPEQCGFNLVQKVYMGETYVNMQQFERTLLLYQRKYTCGEYNIFSFNCNHFTDEFLRELVGKGLPRRIFKATNFLKICCCCLPQDLVNGQWALKRMKKSLQLENNALVEYKVLEEEARLDQP